MRVAEILRSLIDIIAQEEEKESQVQQPVVVNINNGQQQTQPEEVVSDETGVFVPPLQQKIELMKKAQGVESVYNEEPDELEIIKKVAGIRPIDGFNSDEDEPFQG